MTKPGVLDLLKAFLWLENQGTDNQVPDELYMAIREHVRKMTNTPDRGTVYKLGRDIYEALEFTKEVPENPRVPSLTCPCGGKMLWYWRPNSTRGIQCERCGAGGKPMLTNKETA